MLDNDIVAVISVFLVCNTNFAKEGISRLAHDHGREELATEPSTTTRADTGFDDGNLQVRASLGQAVCGGETTRAGTDDDNVGLGILVQVGEVTTGHGSADLRLTDGTEGEVLPLASHGLDGLTLGLASNRNSRVDSAHIQLLGRNSRGDGLLEDHGWGRHCGKGSSLVNLQLIRTCHGGTKRDWFDMHDPFAGIIQKIKFRRSNLRTIARPKILDTNVHCQKINGLADRSSLSDTRSCNR